jgi:hypothetical protein
VRALIALAALSLPLLGTPGCGTIFHGIRQVVPAQSTPDEVGISVEPGAAKYTTPASLSLERRRDYRLTFSKEGYEPATMDIEHHMSGGILVLDILTGLVGVVVDGATGAWYHLTPRTAQALLRKTDAAVDGPSSIRVFVSFKNGSLSIQSSPSGVAVGVSRR